MKLWFVSDEKGTIDFKNYHKFDKKLYENNLSTIVDPADFNGKAPGQQELTNKRRALAALREASELQVTREGTSCSTAAVTLLSFFFVSSMPMPASVEMSCASFNMVSQELGSMRVR